ncbi:rod shape-determining protein RodA [Porphyromonas circumdentaria]|uniref:Cell wall polymerase n=1 Tax=Porphyromonas circumdentaria TaxID=29524 RepID=A0A1T4NF41_9PORP|nr:rod shape-determining protein RodA [Porphyromonas circumdentaria]MBB6275661.1 rod shape determining protein RodA [Porphyromonas circumdentaria]MDO4721900.1 rod shape-determining protein RodA [Porphyromonas circumdentaria]SJZ77733.1 rod shape determining protein RodA [Porphyromonas circumdentaria]
MIANSTVPFFRRLDWFSIILYILLVIAGWAMVCAASYSYDTEQLVTPGSRPMMQLVWIGLSVILILLLLTVDVGWLESLTPVFYIAMLGLLFVTIFVAPEIKGSRSWLVLGPLRLQPAEFAKITTALMLAVTMNRYGFKLSSWRSYAEVFGIILLPVLLIFLEKETGSALVYTALFLALYREGLSGIILGSAFLAVVLFVTSLSLNDILWGDTRAEIWSLATIIMIAVFVLLMLRPAKNKKLFHWLIVTELSLYVLAWVADFFLPMDYSYVAILQLLLLLSYCFFQAFRYYLRRYFLIFFFAIACIFYTLSVSFVFEKVLQPHQQVRISVALGLKEDPKGVGYNVNQAKIAVGSGGLTGKGFLQGTQTKLNYVPEQDTDFIFCTVGEEMGFVGSASLLIVYLMLILRVYYLSERQTTPFGRVYGYCVASIFLFHLAINVGMVIGLVPVIGIPLPFFSYGGSSLWGFTILLFLFLRIDASRKMESTASSPALRGLV